MNIVCGCVWLQTGAWGCFDEFNRINIEVLSVVAQQILSIMSALSSGNSRFIFEGREIRLEWSCGIFVTMNPGKGAFSEAPCGRSSARSASCLAVCSPSHSVSILRNVFFQNLFLFSFDFSFPHCSSFQNPVLFFRRGRVPDEIFNAEMTN